MLTDEQEERLRAVMNAAADHCHGQIVLLAGAMASGIPIIRAALADAERRMEVSLEDRREQRMMDALFDVYRCPHLIEQPEIKPYVRHDTPKRQHHPRRFKKSQRRK